MKQLLVVSSVFLCAIGAAGFPAEGQAKQRFEVSAGFDYRLNESDLALEDSFGFDLGAGVRINEKLMLGARFGSSSADDELGRGGDADIDLWGITGRYQVNSDPSLRFYVVAAIGLGEIEYENPCRGFVPPDPVVPGLEREEGPCPSEPDVEVDESDLFWYEAGVGVGFQAGTRWRFYIDLNVREIDPDDPTVVLDNTSLTIVPAFRAAVRF